MAGNDASLVESRQGCLGCFVSLDSSRGGYKHFPVGEEVYRPVRGWAPTEGARLWRLPLHVLDNVVQRSLAPVERVHLYEAWEAHVMATPGDHDGGDLVQAYWAVGWEGREEGGVPPPSQEVERVLAACLLQPR